MLFSWLSSNILAEPPQPQLVSLALFILIATAVRNLTPLCLASWAAVCLASVPGLVTFALPPMALPYALLVPLACSVGEPRIWHSLLGPWDLTRAGRPLQRNGGLYLIYSNQDRAIFISSWLSAGTSRIMRQISLIVRPVNTWPL